MLQNGSQSIILGVEFVTHVYQELIWPVCFSVILKLFQTKIIIFSSRDSYLYIYPICLTIVLKLFRTLILILLPFFFIIIYLPLQCGLKTVFDVFLIFRFNIFLELYNDQGFFLLVSAFYLKRL